jgi:hypothetical protein
VAILSGQRVTAAMLEKMANPPRARILQSVAQSLPNVTFTAINFEEEQYKVNVGHQSSGNQTYFRIQVDGLYQLTGGCYFAQHNTGIRALKWQVNGVDVPGSGSTLTTFASGQPGVVARTVNVELAIDDTVTLLASQNSGGALNTYVSVDYARADMSIELVRDNSL